MTIAEETTTSIPAPAQSAAPAAALPARTWRLPAIDGMRAMACMMVFAIHTWEFAEKPSMPLSLFGITFDIAQIVRSFPAGVDLFMVLSGFCLFWPLCKSEEALQKWSCKEYIWRRIKRICPPYYIAIAYVILIPQLLVLIMRMAHVNFDGHEARWQPNPSFGNILSHIFFVHTTSFQYWDGITGAFWSLGLEAQFYLVFPLVVLRYRKNRYWAIIGMIVLSLAFRIALNLIYMRYYHINAETISPYGRDAVDELQNLKRLTNISFLGRWMQFASGMLAAMAVADYYRKHKQASGWIGTGLILGALAVYGILLSGDMDGWLRDTLMGILFSVSLFAVTSTRTWIRYLFEFKPIVFLGTISYSIFLIHQPTAWFFSQLMVRKIYKQDLPLTGSLGHWMLMCTAGLVAVLLVAYPFYLLFEKPFIANKKAARKPAAAPSPQPAVPA